MSKELDQKLNQLEGLYLDAKKRADLVPSLQRKIAELEGQVSSLSKRVVTEDLASEIADSLVAEGFLKSASKADFTDRIMNHPDEIVGTMRKVASLRGVTQVGDPDTMQEDAAPLKEMDPLTAFAIS